MREKFCRGNYYCFIVLIIKILLNTINFHKSEKFIIRTKYTLYNKILKLIMIIK